MQMMSNQRGKDFNKEILIKVNKVNKVNIMIMTMTLNKA